MIPPPTGYRYEDLTCDDCKKYVKFGGICIGSTHKKGEKPICPILRRKIVVRI